MTFLEGTNLRATAWGDSSVKIINLGSFVFYFQQKPMYFSIPLVY